MEDRERCQVCGGGRPADAPGRLCAACRQRAGLAGGGSAAGDRDGHDVPDPTVQRASPSSLAATSEPGALARLSETLADVPPRVRLRGDEPFSDSAPVVRPSSAEMPG